MAAVLQQLKRACPKAPLSAQLRYGLRCISGSCRSRGLEEFFPPGVYESGGPAPKEVKTGRRWHAADLRQKSNNDLHKLWYVLLKEMNMLQTVKAEARRLQMPMPNPERIKKVQKSMAMIKTVIGERERAVQRLADIGYQSEHQGEAIHEVHTKNFDSASQQVDAMTSNQDHLHDSNEKKTEQMYKGKALVT